MLEEDRGARDDRPRPGTRGDLGFTQPHEHILVDLFDMKGSYDGILEDRDVAAAEVAAYAAAGGRTIVDTTTIGIGRDPAGSPWSRARPASTS